jgi:ElaB/YqjD/DUF883 family membrane-anchored ribosome-binding protein
MDKTPEQVYTELLRQLASPAGTEPEVLASLFRDVERLHSVGKITDWQLENAREAYARTPRSKTSEAASWALDKANDGLHAAGEFVRDRTRTAATTYTHQDPLRATLVAAATGAVLMGLVLVLARAGARKVSRTVRGR